MSTQLIHEAELLRRIENLIRYGRIVEVDYDTARVKVSFDDTHVSGWLSWMTTRACEGEVRWDAPELGEVVLVFAPSGTLESGVVLPARYSADNAPGENDPDMIVRKHSDGGEDRYARSESARTITLPSDGRFRIILGSTELLLDGSSATITADTIRFNGTSRVETTASDIVLNGKVHLGGEGGKPVARKDDPVAGGKITAGSSEVTSI
ncbi:MAG: phage baseplate assembly protein V [Pseudomonadota bacterium]